MDECEALVEWCWQGKAEVGLLQENPVTVALSPPQIPRGLTWNWTRDSGLRGQRLTAWAMVRSNRDKDSHKWGPSRFSSVLNLISSHGRLLPLDAVQFSTVLPTVLARCIKHYFTLFIIVKKKCIFVAFSELEKDFFVLLLIQQATSLLYTACNPYSRCASPLPIVYTISVKNPTSFTPSLISSVLFYFFTTRKGTRCKIRLKPVF